LPRALAQRFFPRTAMARSPQQLLHTEAVAPLLQENSWPAACSEGAACGGATSSAPPGPKPMHQRPKGAIGSGQREFGVPVGGSLDAGGQVEGSPQQATASLGWLQRGRGSPLIRGPRPQTQVVEQRKKRPAESLVYVDDEFREEQLQRPPPGMVASATASVSQHASSSSGLHSSSSRQSTASTLRHDPHSDSVSRRARDEDEMRQSVSAHSSQDGSLTPIRPEDMDKENFSRSEADRRNEAAPFDLRALRDIVVDEPQEHAEMEEEEEEFSCDDDFDTEGLAEQLAERIQQNVDERYDFEVYVDPENRDAEIQDGQNNPPP